MTNSQTAPEGVKLDPVENKSVSVIFNPVSGKTDPEQRKKLISDALATHGYTCQYLATSKEEGAHALAQKAIKDGVDLIAVSGGDGTVMEVLSAVVGKNIPVAVLPAGTGNLLSINLGIPTSVPEAVHVALSGRRYKLDLAKSEDGKYFAIMGGLGLDAQMIHDADREAKNKFGPLAYFWAALKNVKRRRVRVTVRLDGGAPFTRRVKSVMVANMGKITGGVQAMPTAIPDDGLLDVGLLLAHTGFDWARLVGNALLGRTHFDPNFEVYQVRHVEIETRRPQPCQLDGEDASPRRRWAVEIVPQAVEVLLPEDAPAVQAATKTPAEMMRKTARQSALIPALMLTMVVVAVAYFGKKRRG